MRFFPLVFAGALWLLAGCDSVRNVPNNVRERFTGPVYSTRTFPADQRKTYEAARAALVKMDFRFIRGGPAQGKIEALSPLTTADSLKGSRQTSLDVKLSSNIEGGTDVALLFSEITEDDFNKRSGLGTSTPLHDTPLYEVFYRYLAEALAPPK